MNFIKRLFCNHKYIAYEYYFQKCEDGTKIKRTVWKCTKCGKRKTFFK